MMLYLTCRKHRREETLTNNFLISEPDVPFGSEPQVEKLNRNRNSRPVAEGIEEKKQEDRVQVQSVRALEVDWGEKGSLNNSN